MILGRGRWHENSGSVFELLHPTSGAIVINLQADTNSPVNMCHSLVMCCVGAAFCLAALMSTLSQTVYDSAVHGFLGAAQRLNWGSALNLSYMSHKGVEPPSSHAVSKQAASGALV